MQGNEDATSCDTYIPFTFLVPQIFTRQATAAARPTSLTEQHYLSPCFWRQEPGLHSSHVSTACPDAHGARDWSLVVGSQGPRAGAKRTRTRGLGARRHRGGDAGAASAGQLGVLYEPEDRGECGAECPIPPPIIIDAMKEKQQQAAVRFERLQVRWSRRVGTSKERLLKQ